MNAAAADLDGTILNYGDGSTVRVNHALLSLLRRHRARAPRRYLHQPGRAVLRRAGQRAAGRRSSYPTPARFCLRLRCAIVALSHYGIAVSAVRVSCWHEAGGHAAGGCRRCAASGAGNCTPTLAGFTGLGWRVYTTARAHKPAPLMLCSVGATVYYGDSSEDAQAAANAGIQYHYVERFL